VYHVISCRGAALIDERRARRRRGRETAEDGTMGREPTAIGNWPDDID